FHGSAGRGPTGGKVGDTPAFRGGAGGVGRHRGGRGAQGVRARAAAGGVPEGLVPATAWWVVERDSFAETGDRGDSGRLVGVIHLRHRLNDFLLREGGHIGYAVHPAHRRRAVASVALGLVLGECRARGIDPVLVTT